MVKSKIFFGDPKNGCADQQFNNWSDQNPNALIIDFRYSETDDPMAYGIKYRYHSIAILYEEQ